MDLIEKYTGIAERIAGIERKRHNPLSVIRVGYTIGFRVWGLCVYGLEAERRVCLPWPYHI